MYQSINQEDRYSVKNQHLLKIGDIVLLKEDNTKRITYKKSLAEKATPLSALDTKKK